MLMLPSLKSIIQRILKERLLYSSSCAPSSSDFPAELSRTATATAVHATGLYLFGGTVVNSIVRDNFNANGVHDVNPDFTSAVVTNTCAGVDLGPGNTTADPRFRNPRRGNWRLRSSSPLLDAGSDADYTGDLAAATKAVEVTDDDLGGAPRRQERSIGLGCYEGHSSGLLLMVR